MVAEARLVPPSPGQRPSGLFPSTAEYLAYMEAARRDPDGYWAQIALELDWFSPWQTLREGALPDFRYYVGGCSNVSYNCLDRHVARGPQEAPGARDGGSAAAVNAGHALRRLACSVGMGPVRLRAVLARGEAAGVAARASGERRRPERHSWRQAMRYEPWRRARKPCSPQLRWRPWPVSASADQARKGQKEVLDGYCPVTRHCPRLEMICVSG